MAKKDRETQMMERFRRDRILEGEAGGAQDYSEKMNLSTTIEETEENVKASKKKEVREH